MSRDGRVAALFGLFAQDDAGMRVHAVGATALLSATLANSIDRSNALHKTYAPVDIEAVRSADAARLKGRRRMRAENETGAKVSKR